MNARYIVITLIISAIKPFVFLRLFRNYEKKKSGQDRKDYYGNIVVHIKSLTSFLTPGSFCLIN